MTVIQKSFLGMSWLLTVSSPNAQIATDGTLGAQKNLSGPVFQIDAKLGQQRGGNLFHSFSQFDVNTGEMAIFAGPESVTNILARVTGGQSSFIDGTLRSTIPNANLYLLNPSGILFGENAQLDISGSFHASTADFIDLGDGGRFYAKDVVGNQSILTVAPPSAFGFLSNQAASISIRGSVLKTTEGKTLSLSGGDISIEGGAGLFAPRGEINLTSETGGSISEGEGSWLFALEGKISLTSHGNINISHSYVDVSGDEYYGGEIGGEIFIHADKLFIKDSYLYAQGFQKGGNLTIHAPIFVFDNSVLLADSWAGQGGNISISSDHFILSGNNAIILSSDLSLNGNPYYVPYKEEAERSVAGDKRLFSGYLKSESLLFTRCGGHSEDQSRFVITASDIPQETPYDLQTHWVLPPRGRRGK